MRRTAVSKSKSQRACSFLAFFLFSMGLAHAQTSALRQLYDRGNDVFFKGNGRTQQVLLDSLMRHRSTDPDQRNLEQVFIAHVYRSRGEARRALELLDSLSMDPDKAHSLVRYAVPNERARGLKQLKMLPEALAEAERAHRFAVAFGMREEEVNALVLLAEVHRAQGEYGSALAELIEAEKLATTSNYAFGSCNVAINRGNLLSRQERYPEARTAYRAARECAETGGFPEIEANALFNEAAILPFVHPDSASVGMTIFREALTKARKNGDRELEADVLGEIGRMHNAERAYAEAIREIRRSLLVRSALGDTLGSCSDLLFLSTSFIGAGSLDSALTAVDDAMTLAAQSGDREREAEALLQSAGILVSLGRHQEANARYRTYIGKHDELVEEANGEAMKVMEYRFETKKKEDTIRFQSEQIDSDRLKKRGMLAIAVLLLVVAGLALRNNQHMRRSAEQQRSLHEREVNDLLKQQEIRTLDAMLEGQETERTRIAKDLHDRLGSMLSAIKLQFSALESQVATLRKDQEQQYQQVFGMLDEAVGEVRRISYDLLKTSLSRFGLKGALEDLRATVDTPGKLAVELNLFGMDERLEQRVEVATYRIVQECIGNALKHAKASSLAIQLTRSLAMINIMVEDNGTGFDPALVKEGMGMGNLRQRAAELGGVVRFDSRPGRGTTVNIDIPLRT